MGILDKITKDSCLCTNNRNLSEEIEHTVVELSKDKSYVFLAPIINHMYFNKKPYIYLNRAFYRDLVKSYESCNSTPIKITSDGFQQKLSRLEKQKLLIKINPPNCVNKKNCFRLSEKFTIVENQEEVIAREKSVLSNGTVPFANKPARHNCTNLLDDIDSVTSTAGTIYEKITSGKLDYGTVLGREIVSDLSAAALLIEKSILIIENRKTTEGLLSSAVSANSRPAKDISLNKPTQSSQKSNCLEGSRRGSAETNGSHTPTAAGKVEHRSARGVLANGSPVKVTSEKCNIKGATRGPSLGVLPSKVAPMGEQLVDPSKTECSGGENYGLVARKGTPSIISLEEAEDGASQKNSGSVKQNPTEATSSGGKATETTVARAVEIHTHSVCLDKPIAQGNDLFETGAPHSQKQIHTHGSTEPLASYIKIEDMLLAGTDLAINMNYYKNCNIDINKNYSFNYNLYKNSNMEINTRTKLVSNETNLLTFSINSNYLIQERVNREVTFTTVNQPVAVLAVIYGLISSREMFLVGILNKFYKIEDSDSSERFMLKYNIYSSMLNPHYSSLPSLIKLTLDLTDNNILKTTNILKLFYTAMYLGHYRNNLLNFVNKDLKGTSYKQDLFSLTSEIKKLCSETEDGVKFKKKFMFMLTLASKIVTGGVKKNLKNKILTTADISLKEKSESSFEQERASKYIDKYYGEYLSSITVRFHDSFCCIPEGIKLETQSNDKLKKYMSENYEFCTMFPLSENIIKYYNNKRNNISEVIRKISMQTKTKI